MLIKPSGVFLTVAALAPALTFYQRLGFDMRFRDGGRYAALQGNGQNLNLLAEGEGLPQPCILGCSTADLAAATAHLHAAAARIVTPAKRGPHEEAVLLPAPDGTYIILSQRH